jgi:uncharacterized tellurite resistance protein B-like protein
MLTKLNDFFTFFNNKAEGDSTTEVSLEIACAVLLCEVMRADGLFTELEQ